jgi:hypothetical protein
LDDFINFVHLRNVEFQAAYLAYGCKDQISIAGFIGSIITLYPKTPWICKLKTLADLCGSWATGCVYYVALSFPVSPSEMSGLT